MSAQSSRRGVSLSSVTKYTTSPYHYASSFSICIQYLYCEHQADQDQMYCLLFFFFCLDQTNQENRTTKCERTLQLQILLWMNYPCVFYNGVPIQEKRPVTTSVSLPLHISAVHYSLDNTTNSRNDHEPMAGWRSLTAAMKFSSVRRFSPPK